MSCTFACHKSKYVCALRKAYSLAQWSTITLLVCNMQSAHLSRVIINVFQMMGLLHRTYFFNEQEINYFYIYLNDDHKRQVKIGNFSGCVVLNDFQCFILVTFKGNIPKNEVYELGDSRHTLSMYRGRYIRMSSENTQVHLSKRDWSQLMDLPSACIDKQVIKFGKLQNQLVEWWNKFLPSNTFCTPPNTDVIDFDTLWNKLQYKTRYFGHWSHFD